MPDFKKLARKAISGVKTAASASYHAGETLANVTGAGYVTANFVIPAAKGTYQVLKSPVGYTIRTAWNAAPDVLSVIPVVGETLADLGNKLPKFSDEARVKGQSPEALAKKREQYSESYDLSLLKTQVKKAGESIRNSALNHLKKRDGDTIDVTSFEGLKAALEARQLPPAERSQCLGIVNDKIGSCLELTSSTQLISVSKNIIKSIEKGENPTNPKLQDPNIVPIHDPVEVAASIEAIYEKAKDTLEKERKAALRRLDELFAPAPAGDRVFKNNLAKLLGLPADQIDPNDTTPAVQRIIMQQKDAFATKMNDSYDAALQTLHQDFNGKPASKDKDGKDISPTEGILSEAKRLQQTSQYDLDERINGYETILAANPTFSFGHQGLKASMGGVQPNPTKFKKGVLKGVSLKRIKQTLVPGYIWGMRGLDIRTPSGTKINIIEEDHHITISVKIPGTFFLKGNRKQIESEFMKMASVAAANGSKKLHWKIDASSDELRKQMILEAYKVGRKFGYKPSDMKFTVSGANEKEQCFQGKDGAETLNLIGHGNYDGEIKAEIDKWTQQQADLSQQTMSDMKSRLAAHKLEPRGLTDEDDNDKPIAPPSP